MNVIYEWINNDWKNNTQLFEKSLEQHVSKAFRSGVFFFCIFDENEKKKSA